MNSLPSRRDPPSELIRLAVGLGCRFSIDSDAHAPDELDGKAGACEQAAANGVTVDRVVNALDVGWLLDWTEAHHLGSGA